MSVLCDKPQRFVPTGRASYSDDAPGWGGGGGSGDNNNESSSKLSGDDDNDDGPICWKCRGIKRKHKPIVQRNNNKASCTVCQGRGRLPCKKKRQHGDDKKGRITKARKPFASWVPSGPSPFGAATATCAAGDRYWADLVQLADDGKDVDLDEEDTEDNASLPAWVPRRGEELCRLSGSWRILQRVGCHRWTTDDLLTAWVAACEIGSTRKSSDENSRGVLRYLDLGTGNASVLQMVLWSALKQDLAIQALGVEARSEAVQLARRSLAFNLGPNDNAAKVSVAKGDFREYPFEPHAYDLVTGTPPYFRVDFHVDPKNDSVVQAAFIQQGGMPTAKQSAPARCEFRGGIEAYCAAAARALVVSSTAKFVVCENFKNHERVQVAAVAAGLKIVKQVHVEGRPGRGILFAVYVMSHAVANAETENPQEVKLTVRGEDGDWTPEYLNTVMKDMSIPALNSQQTY